MFFVVRQHLLLVLELFDQEREICDVCVVQQQYSLQIGLCLQEKETLSVFCVRQHLLLVLELSDQEREI